MVASHRLMCEDFDVTTYHHRLYRLKNWFSNHKLKPFPTPEKLEDTFSQYDFVIVQDSPSKRVGEVKNLFYSGIIPKMSVFYSTFDKATNPPLTRWDRVFNEKMSKVENISRAIASLLKQRYHSKNNGLNPPTSLTYRKDKKSILIRLPKLMRKKYARSFQKLEEDGYRLNFLDDQAKSGSLDRLAQTMFQAGYVISSRPMDYHLASNLQIPTLVISSPKQKKNFLKPGWLKSTVFFRSSIRLRDRLTFQRSLLAFFRTRRRRDTITW
ncbi:MAG: hypothetical protein S4CHLAM102_11120 [Chlamydiia bacterium]|nr:hypothetical protein [Chlamydiia bacterium]